jgi:hypothetical protein
MHIVRNIPFKTRHCAVQSTIVKECFQIPCWEIGLNLKGNEVIKTTIFHSFFYEKQYLIVISHITYKFNIKNKVHINKIA